MQTKQASAVWFESMGVYRYCDNLCFETAKYTVAWLMVKGKSVKENRWL